MCLSGLTAFGICLLTGLLSFNYARCIHKLYFTIVLMKMESSLESSLDVRDRQFSPALQREVTPDPHQAARWESNSNWCHYVKTKMGLNQRNQQGVKYLFSPLYLVHLPELDTG